MVVVTLGNIGLKMSVFIDNEIQINKVFGVLVIVCLCPSLCI